MSHLTVQGQDCHGTNERPNQYQNRVLILWQLDAGMHTGREGMAAMPYFDDFDLGLVDILLISQYVHPTPLLLLRVFIWQRRMQCGTSGHMGSIDHELGATEQVSPKPTVSMLYLRSGQYHAFQSTCSILELLRRHSRSASIVSPYCHPHP